MTTPLTGKSFWLDRKIRLWTRSQLGTLIAARGGTVAEDIVVGTSYVVLDAARRTPEPAQQAASVGATVLTLDELYALLCPSRDEALALLRGGRASAEQWAARLPLATSPVAIDLTGADLRNLDLTGFLFRRCDFTGANLGGVTLDNVTFVGAQGLDLRKIASARGLTISSARHCDFDDIDLTGVKLDGRFEECTFRRTVLRDAEAGSVELRDCIATEGDWSGADFSGCVALKLNALTLRCHGTHLNRANFTEARLDGADFTSAVLEEATFENTHVEHACFGRANLRGANFIEAVVNGTDYRNANLAEADFTGAKVTHANFTAANLRGTKLVRTTAKRKTTTTPANSVLAMPVPTLPPALAALREGLNAAPNWVLSFALVTSAAGLQRWTFETLGKGRVRTTSTTRGEVVQAQVTDWFQALLDLQATNRDALPQLDTVRVLPVALGTALEMVPCGALSTLFGLPAPAEAAPVSLLTALTGGVEVFLRHGEPAVTQWNLAHDIERRALAECQNVNLAGLNLAGIEFSHLDASGANLERADLTNALFRQTILQHARLGRAILKGANLGGADCRGASAEKVDLSGTTMQGADWRGANLREANLKKANLHQARFQAADLSDANLSEVAAHGTQYDDSTRFPDGYKPGTGWVSTSATEEPAPADFNAFYHQLSNLVAHLGRDVFSLHGAQVAPLWAQVTEDGLRGVVPEAANATTFRACHLSSAGAHQCGTQNFTLCEDAAKGLCKHLVALLLDLAKTERLPLGDAARWARLSLAHEGQLDKNLLAAIFAQYADSTQSDYRPNETLPEDYYAL